MTGQTTRRIVIVGSPGAGKSTLAARLASQSGLTHIELDSLYHLPGWSHPTPTEFQENLVCVMDEAEAVTRGWVTCGNYGTYSDQVHLARAETVVWLDLDDVPKVSAEVRGLSCRWVMEPSSDPPASVEERNSWVC